ncbi:MAG TPA: hypothetical protein VGM97_00930 [Steroidobacteraceae bacterium]|jgi:uncharacterized protein YbcV (DUF1398 family)
MTANWKELARTTLEGSESGAMSFPESVQILMRAGFDGYAVDFRRSTRTYYMTQGESIELQAPPVGAPVAARFDAGAVKAAIRDAQGLVPGYTYAGFCARVVGAGCAGYQVSLLGRRVLYFGRTGDTHTEYFPGAEPRHNDVMPS